jgi:hypothetical protein
MTATWKTKQGDYHRRIQLSITDLDLTGATGVVFRMRSREGGALVVNDAAGTIDIPGKTVSYQFVTPQLANQGLFDLEATVTFGDGPETVPTEAHVLVIIGPRLAA